MLVDSITTLIIYLEKFPNLVLLLLLLLISKYYILISKITTNTSIIGKTIHVIFSKILLKKYN